MKCNSFQKGRGFCVAILIFCVAASGCVELKYTALNRLDDPVAIRSSRAPESIYFSFASVRQKDRQYTEYFTSMFFASIEKKGFTVADTPDRADIVINAQLTFYKKANGTFLFVLILPVYRFNEDYDGLAMSISYKTDQGRWQKKYRVYYRGWLDGDLEIASDLLLRAIIKDINLSPPEG
ncbi:MAG: hypothetical protein WC547_02605 [Candidatus Omnitrophota bacterium]